MLSRVFRLKLEGPVTGETFIKLQKDLALRLWLYKPTCIALEISSASGSAIQAKNLGKFLRKFGEKHKAPLYTFAGSQVFGPAHILLCSGHRVYSNRFSIIGDFGTSRHWMGYKQLINNFKVDVTTIKAGKFKDRLSPYENLRKADEEFLEKIGTETDFLLQNEILALRASSFAKKNVTNEKINEVLFSSTPIKTQQLVDVGYVDEIASWEEIKHKNFKGQKEIVLKLKSGQFSAPDTEYGHQLLYSPNHSLIVE